MDERREIIARGKDRRRITAAQRREYMPRMAAGISSARLRCRNRRGFRILATSRERRRRDGDGGSSNGTKILVYVWPMARIHRGGWRERSSPVRSAPPHEGIRPFCAKEAGQVPPGLTGIGHSQDRITSDEDLGDALENFKLPADALIGREREDRGEGHRILRRRQRTRGRARALRGACDSGFASEARKTRWIRQKRSRVRARRSEDSSDSFKLAEMATETKPNGSLMYHSSRDEVDRKRRCDKDGLDVEAVRIRNGPDCGPQPGAAKSRRLRPTQKLLPLGAYWRRRAVDQNNFSKAYEIQCDFSDLVCAAGRSEYLSSKLTGVGNISKIFAVGAKIARARHHHAARSKIRC